MICTPHEIYSTQVNKSKRMRWTGHAARMGEACVRGFDGEI